MITRRCIECHGEFQVKTSVARAGNGKLCSMRCANIFKSKNYTGKNSGAWKGGTVTLTCKLCGKPFEAKPCHVRKGYRKFCSKKCMYAATHTATHPSGKDHPRWKGGLTATTCKLCHKPFSVRPDQVKRGVGRFCSRSCSSMWTKAHMRKAMTTIELAVVMELARREVEHQPQYPIPAARTVVDVFIPPNICVYADGDYWHSSIKVKQRDAKQDEDLLRLGYQVYRFREADIRISIASCVDRIQEIK